MSTRRRESGGAGQAPTPGRVLVSIRVTTRASRTTVGPVKDGRLHVRVTAAPVDSAANEAVVRAVAEALHVAPSRARITAGLTSRNKTVEVLGLTRAAVDAALGLSAPD